MEGLLPFVSALGLIVVLELGDKTQLATISLASRHAWGPVFLGAASGLVLVTAIGAAAGYVLSEALRPWMSAIQIGGGLLFIGFGLWTFARVEREEPDEARDSRSAFLAAFTMNTIAEMGDKTQIAVIILAASTAAPLSVFAGASLALASVAAASVALGAALARVLQRDRIRLASGALFVAAGVLLILEALWPG